jgi:hypothetical protein
MLAKSDANLRDRGFDVEFASLIFDALTFRSRGSPGGIRPNAVSLLSASPTVFI